MCSKHNGSSYDEYGNCVGCMKEYGQVEVEVEDAPVPCVTWTKQDLAELTVQATLRDEGYCEHCQVVPVGFNEKYCIKCTEVMLDDMARWYKEQHLAEQGLY